MIKILKPLLFCLLAACSIPKSDSSLNFATELKGTIWKGEQSDKKFTLSFRHDGTLKATVQVEPSYDRSDFLAQKTTGTTVELSDAIGTKHDKVIMNLTGPDTATATFTLTLFNNKLTNGQSQQTTFQNVQLTKQK